MSTFSFRLIVRGNTPEGQRVRRVRSIDAPTYEDAWHIFSEHAEDMSDGLTDLAYSVLPPTGWRVDGSISKGFEAA